MPPPIKVTVLPLVPPRITSVKLPVEFCAIVPSTVIIPLSVVPEPFSNVSVLPLLIVGLFVVPSRVALPLLLIAPPLAVVSVPPLIVAPLRFTTDADGAAIIVVGAHKVERTAAGGLERAGIGRAVTGIEREGDTLVGIDNSLIVQGESVAAAANAELPGALDSVAGTVDQCVYRSDCKCDCRALLDRASVPPPLRVIVLPLAPPRITSVKLPVEFCAIVPSTLIVPLSVVPEPFSKVSVLPALIVGLFVVPSRVALPLLLIAPPLAVVSVPPLIVAPLRFTTELVPVLRMVPPLLL